MNLRVIAPYLPGGNVLMSAKNTLVYNLTPTPQSLSTDFISPPTVVRFLDNCSYQINVTTIDSVGTFVVEVSNDYYVDEGNNSVVSSQGNWVALQLSGGSGIPFVNAANDTIAISLNQLPFYAVRLRYTSTTAGTGTCAIFVTDKRLG